MTLIQDAIIDLTIIITALTNNLIHQDTNQTNPYPHITDNHHLTQQTTRQQTDHHHHPTDDNHNIHLDTHPIDHHPHFTNDNPHMQHLETPFHTSNSNQPKLFILPTPQVTNHHTVNATTVAITTHHTNAPLKTKHATTVTNSIISQEYADLAINNDNLPLLAPVNTITTYNHTLKHTIIIN